MLPFTTGDILAENTEALVNTVNCIGVMGRGIALQFKKAFPDNFCVYAKACQRGEVKLGTMFVFETGTLTNPRTLINFPTSGPCPWDSLHGRANPWLQRTCAMSSAP